MKTTISLPDAVFHEAEAVAQQLGISRSELYTKALSEYLRKHSNAQVTAKFNEVYAEEDSRLDPVLAKMQYSAISPEDWSSTAD
ncbi:MAG: ribbon-helix-helix domain-containing protein [Phormidesmis sp.]